MLKFIVDHPVTGRIYMKCVMLPAMAQMFIGKPMQGGVCVGVLDMDKPVADNKCHAHMDRHQPTRKQVRHETVCATAPRTRSENPFPLLPVVKQEKVKRGWKQFRFGGKLGAAVMHGETRTVLSKQERMRNMIRVYAPAISPWVGAPEPGSWFPRPTRIYKDVQTKKENPAAWWRHEYHEMMRLKKTHLTQTALTQLLITELSPACVDSGTWLYD